MDGPGRVPRGDGDAERVAQQPRELAADTPGTPQRREQEVQGGCDAPPGRTAEAVPAGVAIMTIIRELALDAGLPVAAYVALFLIGVTGWPAVLAATLSAVSRVIWVGVQGRALNPFAMLMVVVLGLDLALYSVTGDARVVLIKSAIMAATLGVMFLVMVVLGRPPTLEAVKMWEPKRAAWRAEQFRTNPAVRHGYRTVSTVWGAGFLAEAIVLFSLAYVLPAEVMSAAAAALGFAWLAALIGWTGWYQRHVA